MMWLPQQEMQCVLWLTEFKSITRVHRRVRTEWNAVTDLAYRLIRIVIFYHENLRLLASSDTKVPISFKVLSHWWINLYVGRSAFHSVRRRCCPRVTDLNSVN
ncbi:uncharacterized protein TNCV_1674731 [Trichonephila clavipes]|nr:uncharacterized protein TNCV_1674731 [Trichonephila clavipes]